MDANATATPSRTDWTSPLARTGESQYAVIVRNRSGIDAGCIDFTARMIDELGDGDKQDAVSSAFSLYTTWRDSTGKRAPRDLTRKLLESLRAAVSHIEALRGTLQDCADLGMTIAICGTEFDHEAAKALVAWAENDS